MGLIFLRNKPVAAPSSAWPASAVLAYSVARVMNPGHTGNLIRVRRSSDNAEADIGAASGVLDETALLAHCGAGDGYLVKVYEQSGHASAVDWGQATAGLQPKIVNSGAVVKVDGYPAFNVSSATIHMAAETWATRPSNATSVSVWAEGAARGLTSVEFSTPDAGVNPAVGILADGSALANVSASSGSLSYYKNGALVGTDSGGITRDDMHTAFATGALLVSRTTGLDFTLNAQYDELATTYRASGVFPGREYYSEVLIMSAPTAGEISAWETEVASHYGGITLA